MNQKLREWLLLQVDAKVVAMQMSGEFLKEVELFMELLDLHMKLKSVPSEQMTLGNG